MEAQTFESFLNTFDSILLNIRLMLMNNAASSGLLRCIRSFLNTIANNGLILAFVMLSVIGAGIGLIRRIIDL